MEPVSLFQLSHSALHGLATDIQERGLEVEYQLYSDWPLRLDRDCTQAPVPCTEKPPSLHTVSHSDLYLHLIHTPHSPSPPAPAYHPAP